MFFGDLSLFQGVLPYLPCEFIMKCSCCSSLSLSVFSSHRQQAKQAEKTWVYCYEIGGTDARESRVNSLNHC